LGVNSQFLSSGAGLGHFTGGFDGLGRDSHFSAIGSWSGALYRLFFFGLGRDSHFSAIGGWSGLLCRWVLIVWVEIAIFLPSGADLGHWPFRCPFRLLKLKTSCYFTFPDNLRLTLHVFYCLGQVLP
jgi:hypothetical protein